MPSSQESISPRRFAAVEGGGTSFKVVVCQEEDFDDNEPSTIMPKIIHRYEVSCVNQTPDKILEDCSRFLKEHGPYRSLGIATFGPVGLDVNKPESYGHILSSSPKAAWRQVDFLTPLRDACLSVNGSDPTLHVAVETDVNAPAWAEYKATKNQSSSPMQGISSLAYITVGTGVGVGLIINGQPVHGFLHPELGHVPVHPLPGDSFGGYSWGRQNPNIPFHGQNTVEGLASSVALVERYCQSAPRNSEKIEDRSILKDLPDNDEVWDHAVNALAQLCVNLLLLSVEKIVLGGGVMNRTNLLLPKIQNRVVELLQGYLPLPYPITDMIVVSNQGSDAGLVGAIMLAKHAGRQNSDKQLESAQIKRAAFNHGLWHGFLVGILSTAFVYKYALRNRGVKR